MKKMILGMGACLLLTACGSVPITGRKQMLLVSDSEVLNLSLQQYSDFKKTAPVSTDKTNTALVEKVGKKIASAVETYMSQAGLSSQLSGYSWEFNLIKSTDVNAFCMPGGKIVVYEGILPVTQTETGLAVVLGHEVAHAIAKHANERMSQQLLTQYGGTALGTVLQNSSATTQTMANTLYGIGSQYGVALPHSRKQELEADKLGLIFMAMAGYEPNQAVGFWQRMAQSSNSKVSEFMSTHPSDETRIAKVQQELPEALKYYKAPVSTTTSTTKKRTTTKKK
ncbi:MAG: peptidase Ste24p [Bacteroidetes bacterium]|nr:peptidase Ste24p [Bacteroidota bacterium]